MVIHEALCYTICMGQAEVDETVAKVEEQQILFVPLPRAIKYWSRTDFYFLIVLIIAIPVSVMTLTPPNTISIFVAIGFFFLIYNVFLFCSIIVHRNQDRKCVDSIRDHTANFTTKESDEIAQIFVRTFREIKGGLSKASLPRLKAIVDPLLQEEIQSINLRHELMEPEPVESSFPIKDFGSRYFMILMMMALFQSIRDQSWFLAVLSLSYLLISIFPRVTDLRERFSFLRSEDASILVGPGWVKHTKRNRNWSVADSIILLRLRKRKALGTLYVRLLGPTRELNFTFESVRDPEFIRLWQRWMHPNPRLELMEQDSELSPSVKV